ncbi:MAG: hypothetical protein SFU91_12810 [Chloroherpetonaceae bacterium]|nr:hypothetical protein [Chloroherpetonaceae bacterium]
MKINLLFEGISDKESFEVLLKEEIQTLKTKKFEVNANDYGGRKRGFTRILPKEIKSSFEVYSADYVFVHIDSEEDSKEQMNENIEKMKRSIPVDFHNRVFWIVIRKNLESVLLAGCLEKERNFEEIQKPKKAIRGIFGMKLKKGYIETIDAKEYISQVSKERILSRISGVKDFQQGLNQISEFG